jgi:hypothetical protein
VVVMLDLNPILAELCLARQTNRKMVTIHVDDLQSLISRAQQLMAVQSMIPVRVGYCQPADLHALQDAEKFVIPMRRKKGTRYTVTMCAYWIPDRPPYQPPTE